MFEYEGVIVVPVVLTGGTLDLPITVRVEVMEKTAEGKELGEEDGWQYCGVHACMHMNTCVCMCMYACQCGVPLCVLEVCTYVCVMLQSSVIIAGPRTKLF